MSDSSPAPDLRALLVIYARDVPLLRAFYQRLGFEQTYEFPAEDGTAGFVGLRRGAFDMGIVTTASPEQLAGVEVGTKPRFELYVFVDDVDASVEALRSTGVEVLREPEDMPWGDRAAYLCDPEGNVVTLGHRQPG